MRPVLVLSLIALAAFASGVGYFMRTAIESGDSMAPVAQPAETPVPTIQPANSALQIRMVTLRESSPEYSIDVVYPQLGLSFDSEIRDLFDESSAQIRNLARDYPPDSVSPGPYTLASTLHSVYVDPDVVSIRLSIYSYTGGAHGGSATFGFNLNRDSGTELTIDEALSLIGLSISEVADQALRQLKAELDFAVFQDGVSAHPGNFQTFVVNADEVIFIFQEYQVAPYAAGPQEVSFPRVRRLP